jgi:hypothetical protein
LGRRVRHSSCLSKNPGITAGTDQL